MSAGNTGGHRPPLTVQSGFSQKISGIENVNTPFSRISEMMISLFFGFNTTPKGFLSVVLGPMGIFHFGGVSPLSSYVQIPRKACGGSIRSASPDIVATINLFGG